MKTKQIRIDAALHPKLKSLAAWRGISMQELCDRILRKAVEKGPAK